LDYFEEDFNMAYDVLYEIKQGKPSDRIATPEDLEIEKKLQNLHKKRNI
jgi:predicted DNA-binding protein